MLEMYSETIQQGSSKLVRPKDWEPLRHSDLIEKLNSRAAGGTAVGCSGLVRLLQWELLPCLYAQSNPLKSSSVSILE